MDYDAPQYKHGGKEGTRWTLEDRRVRGVTRKYPHLVVWGWGIFVVVLFGGGLILEKCQ